MKDKVIKFALSERLWDITPPQPAKQYLPEWFKNTPRFMGTADENPLNAVKTFKVCMPFTDSLISGYIFELWADLYVIRDSNTGIQTVRWKEAEDHILGTRQPEQTGSMPPFKGYSDVHYTLSHPLYLKTPPGYSVIITQPFNRPDLPFYAMTGVVDTDKHPLFPGNYSLFLKEDFEGIIKMGTPLFQIIPIKRDKWISESSREILAEGWRASSKSVRTILGWYRDHAWAKKSYK
jgi:hypothetical protein